MIFLLVATLSAALAAATPLRPCTSFDLRATINSDSDPCIDGYHHSLLSPLPAAQCDASHLSASDLSIRIPCSLFSPDSHSHSPASRALTALRAAADWTEHTDPHTGRKFYCHKTTQHCAWSNTDAATPLPLCTVEHLRISYTRCSQGKRSLVYYFDANSCFGGIQLPPPIGNLPCDISCAAGQHLKAGASECEACSPGTFSIGGGKRYTSWESIPSEFRTYFRDHINTQMHEDATAGWVTAGDNVNSGGRNVHNSESVLELAVELVREGSVTFEYRVDAEQEFDALIFFVDSVRELRSSYQFNYQEFTVDLAAGFHVLKWVYRKDSSVSHGADTAFIRKIEVLGTEFNDQECSLCPAGFTSAAGSASCSPCPLDTISTAPGSATCTPCPTGKYALPGSRECKDRPTCSPADVVTTFTVCDGEHRIKSISFKQPKICQGGENLIKDPEIVPCAPCDPGKFRNGTQCDYCPDGTYSSPVITTAGSGIGCALCPAGKMAKNVRFYDTAFSPDEVAGEITTGCEGGYCGAGGWRFLGDRMDSGAENGPRASLWVGLPVNLISAGDLKFNYSLTGSVGLELYLDGHLAFQTTAQTAPVIYQISLDEGRHSMRWVATMQPYGSYSTPMTNNDRVEIFSIVVTGVEKGGAIACDPCPAGSVSKEGSSKCTPCQPGFYQSGTECFPCPSGKYSSRSGATECSVCGKGTTSEPGSTDCHMEEGCVWTADEEMNVVYNLSGVADRLIEVRETNRSFVYHLSLCDRNLVNSTCQEKSGEPMQAFACQTPVNSNSAFNLGRRVALDNDANNPDKGLVMTFFDGTASGCAEPRKTVVNLLCDLDVGVGSPKTDVVEEPKCVYTLDWPSLHACRACHIDDFEAVAGECIPPGKQDVHYIKKAAARCHGDPPSTTTLECEEVVVSHTSAVVGVSIALAVVALLLASMVFLFVRNRQIYKQYAVLKEQNEADLELEKYTLDDDDDA